MPGDSEKKQPKSVISGSEYGKEKKWFVDQKTQDQIIAIIKSCNDKNKVESINQIVELIKGYTYLDLTGTKMGDKGAMILAEALKQNRSLTGISLQDNEIENEGAIALSGAFKIHPSLKDVDLMINKIGDKGALMIADMLKTNRVIKKFTLSDNPITESGLRNIENALKFNGSIEEFNCNRIRIPDQEKAKGFIDRIEELLKANKVASEQALELRRNKDFFKGFLLPELWEMIINYISDRVFPPSAIGIVVKALLPTANSQLSGESLRSGAPSASSSPIAQRPEEGSQARRRSVSLEEQRKFSDRFSKDFRDVQEKG